MVCRAQEQTVSDCGRSRTTSTRPAPRGTSGGRSAACSSTRRGSSRAAMPVVHDGRQLPETPEGDEDCQDHLTDHLPLFQSPRGAVLESARATSTSGPALTAAVSGTLAGAELPDVRHPGLLVALPDLRPRLAGRAGRSGAGLRSARRDPETPREGLQGRLGLGPAERSSAPAATSPGHSSA